MIGPRRKVLFASASIIAFVALTSFVFQYQRQEAARTTMGSSIVFDFRLYNSGSSSNLGGIEVPRGGSGSVTITVTLENGTAETVTLSCAGASDALPAGVSYDFTPASASPPFTSTLTITASSFTPQGYYTIKVTATAGDVTRQTLFILKVT